jgi:hypothetical protein
MMVLFVEATEVRWPTVTVSLCLGWPCQGLC